MRTLVKLAAFAATSYAVVFLYRNQPLDIRIQIVKQADALRNISNGEKTTSNGYPPTGV